MRMMVTFVIFLFEILLVPYILLNTVKENPFLSFS